MVMQYNTSSGLEIGAGQIFSFPNYSFSVELRKKTVKFEF